MAASTSRWSAEPLTWTTSKSCALQQRRQRAARATPRTQLLQAIGEFLRRHVDPGQALRLAQQAAAGRRRDMHLMPGRQRTRQVTM
jgi:hypothetical protein